MQRVGQRLANVSMLSSIDAAACFNVRKPAAKLQWFFPVTMMSLPFSRFLTLATYGAAGRILCLFLGVTASSLVRHPEGNEVDVCCGLAVLTFERPAFNVANSGINLQKPVLALCFYRSNVCWCSRRQPCQMQAIGRTVTVVICVQDHGRASLCNIDSVLAEFGACRDRQFGGTTRPCFTPGKDFVVPHFCFERRCAQCSPCCVRHPLCFGPFYCAYPCVCMGVRLCAIICLWVPVRLCVYRCVVCAVCVLDTYCL
jgi:hypothetical protein